MYCMTLTTHTQGPAEHSALLEMSTSFREMSLEAKSDTSYAPSSDTPPSSQESCSGSGSASANGHGREWSERKWLVNESSLLKLFKVCSICGSAIVEKKSIPKSSQIQIQWGCLNGHSGMWSSCPDIRGMARNSLLISAATLFSGTTHTTIMDWAGLLRAPIPQKTHYYAIQSTYLIPVI